jgi:hypothetical protein
MRIFHAIENDVHAFAGDGFFERCESLRGSKGYDTLMRGGACYSAIEHFARLKAHGHAAFARQIDNLLHARSGGAFGDQDTI